MDCFKSDLMTPLLYVLCAKHGEAKKCIKTFVETSAEAGGGFALAGMETPRKHVRYPFKLDGKDVELVDAEKSFVNVHFNEQYSSCDPFLGLLEETGKAAFYPPLVILGDDCERDEALLKCLRMVFPSVVCAVRCKKQVFATLQDGFSLSSLKDVPLFHFEDVDGRRKPGMCQSLTAENLKKIGAYYSSLMPTRDELDFSSDQLMGDAEALKIGVEKETKDKATEQSTDNHENQEADPRRIVRFSRTGYKKRWSEMDQAERNLAFQFISQAIASFLHEDAWIPISEELIQETPVVAELEAIGNGTRAGQSHFVRDVSDIYRVLRNGMRIYYGEVKGDWRKVEDELQVKHML